jgi:hypothetical protein
LSPPSAGSMSWRRTAPSTGCCARARALPIVP